MAPATKTVYPLDRFKRASEPAFPRIIGCSVGPPGTRKTSFWLGAPGPIVIQSLDFGLEGVIERFQEEKEIRFANYDWSPSEEDQRADGFQQDAIKLRDQFIKDFVFACEHARTVIWDKETDVWNLFRYAAFGAPKADVARDFDVPNQLMRKYINWPKKLTINFGLIEDVREEWASQNKKTGAVKRAGFREVEGLVHVDMFHSFEDGVFKTSIGAKARGPAASTVQGKTFDNLDFVTLGMTLFPDTDEDSWV